MAPLWAGLVAVANAQLGTQVGFLQPVLYAAGTASALHDITVGNNGAYSAGPGWDACTGLGSPIADKLIPLLAAASAAKKPTKKKSTIPAQKKTAAKKATRKAAKKTKKTAAKKSVMKKKAVRRMV